MIEDEDVEILTPLAVFIALARAGDPIPVDLEAQLLAEGYDTGTLYRKYSQ